MSVKAENSRTADVEKYGAHQATDLNFDTYSGPIKGSEGVAWFKLHLDQVHCVAQIVTFLPDGRTHLNFTCSQTSCTCQGHGSCKYYFLTVSSKSMVNGLPPVPNCKYGDTLKLQRHTGTSFKVIEIAVVGKQGEMQIQLHGTISIVINHAYKSRWMTISIHMIVAIVADKW